MKILAGDIGGTKTILQLAQYSDGEFSVLAEQRYKSADFDSFESVMQQFFQQCAGGHNSIDAACVGVAGPVNQDTAQVTNLPWLLDRNSLARQFGIGGFYLINDFQAVGYGIERLMADDLVVLQQGQHVPQGTRAVIGAGTGVGHAILVNLGDQYQVLPCEAGHAGFAPANEEQVDLLRYLLRKFDVMSVERVLSGPGILNIFSFVTSRQREQLSPALDAASSQDDSVPIIVDLALQGKDQAAVRTLQLFVDIYGSAAGNLALTALATGGIYIAGGIAPRILPLLTSGAFVHAFNNKSKMKDLLAAIPVKVINNPKVGLAGAALYAVRHRQ